MFLLSLILAATSYAAATGTLVISGTIPLACDIVVTANGSNNTNLNIVSGETNKLVGSATETCNNATGYKVNVLSANGGELRNTVTPTLKTTYTLTYGSTTITPTTVYQQVKNVTVLNSAANVNSNITVTTAPYAAGMAGTYSDTITVQISANP